MDLNNIELQLKDIVMTKPDQVNSSGIDFSQFDPNLELEPLNYSLIDDIEELYTSDLPTNTTKNLLIPSNKIINSEYECMVEELKSRGVRGKRYTFKDMVDAKLIADNGYFNFTISNSKLIKLLKLRNINSAKLKALGIYSAHKGVLYKYNPEGLPDKTAKCRVAIHLDSGLYIHDCLEMYDGAKMWESIIRCLMFIGMGSTTNIITSVYAFDVEGGYKIVEDEYSKMLRANPSNLISSEISAVELFKYIPTGFIGTREEMIKYLNNKKMFTRYLKSQKVVNTNQLLY